MVCVVDCYQYMEMDAALYDKCARESVEKVRMRDAEREASQVMWAALIAAAAAKENSAHTGNNVTTGNALVKGNNAAMGQHIKH